MVGKNHPIGVANKGSKTGGEGGYGYLDLASQSSRVQ